MRIALLIEYDGTRYYGWQSQPGGNTIQQEIERAIHEITGQNIRIHGAGRTDAGVHAFCQVAHFDIVSGIPAEKFSYALNSKLPEDISILESFEIDGNFHSRFSANGKCYSYVIRNTAQRSALNRTQCMWVPRPLDLESMREAARYILGTHDFKAFCSAHSSVADTVRTVESLDMVRDGCYIKIDICGNGFLHNMVRIIVGTLIDVGHGKMEPREVKDIIESKDRKRAGATADASGLFLVEVMYE